MYLESLYGRDMTRGRPTGLTEIEVNLLRAGLVAAVRAGQDRFWAFEVQKVFEDIAGRSISWGTLFPALRRLELMGHLTSEWSPTDGSRRPIRYYRLTESGEAKAAAATAPSAGGVPFSPATWPGLP